MKWWISFKIYQNQGCNFFYQVCQLIDRDRIRLVLEYPEDSAGGLLNTDTISVQQDHTLDIVIKYLKSFEKLPKNTDKIFVVSKNNQFIGELYVIKHFSGR